MKNQQTKIKQFVLVMISSPGSPGIDENYQLKTLFVVVKN